MTFLPIVGRELRVNSRLWRTYWGRVGAAALTLLVAGSVFFEMGERRPQTTGQVVFISIAACACFMCLMSGPANTADCLSVERREGTLGFLFLTNLRAYDIILGKLAAYSLRAVYSLLASLPIIAVPLLMGGVGLGEFLRVALVLANTMFLSLTVGILTSTLFKSTQHSVGSSAIGLMTVSIGLPLFAFLWAQNYGTPVNELLLLPSPGFAFASALAPLQPRYAAGYWLSNAIIFSTSLTCLLIAARILPHTWQDRPATPKRQRWRDGWRNLQFGNATARSRHRRFALDENPFFWLVTRAQIKRATMWIALAFLAGLWLGLAVYHGAIWMDQGTYIGTTVVLMYMFRLIIASDSVQTIADARATNALELLLSTPLTVPDIIAGHWQALKQFYLRPLLVTLAALILFFVLGWSEPEVRRAPFDWVVLWVCGIAVFIADLLAAFVVGLWSGLVGKNAQQANGMVMGRVFVVPWVIFGGACMIGGLLDEMLPSGLPNPPDWAFIVLWAVISLMCDALMAWWAWRRLHERFRLVAMTRYQPPTSFWQRLFGSRNVSAGN